MRLLILLLLSSLSLADGVALHNDIKNNLRYIAYSHSLIKGDLYGVPILWAEDKISDYTVRRLKDNINKSRPNGLNNRSFPSGHTATAFQPAFFIMHRYGFKEAIPYLLAASFVGYVRVKSKYHYAEDVLGSVLITYATSFAVTKSFTLSSDGKSHRLEFNKAF